jgi:hypothetical protein
MTSWCLVKALYRKEAFKTVAPSVPLPPEQILMHWGTWLCAASYYTEHLETDRNVVNKLIPNWEFVCTFYVHILGIYFESFSCINTYIFKGLLGHKNSIPCDYKS